MFLCLVCKASKICFINNEVNFSESFALTFQMVKSQIRDMLLFFQGIEKN